MSCRHKLFARANVGAALVLLLSCVGWEEEWGYLHDVLSSAETLCCYTAALDLSSSS